MTASELLHTFPNFPNDEKLVIYISKLLPVMDLPYDKPMTKIYAYVYICLRCHTVLPIQANTAYDTLSKTS